MKTPTRNPVAGNLHKYNKPTVVPPKKGIKAVQRRVKKVSHIDDSDG